MKHIALSAALFSLLILAGCGAQKDARDEKIQVSGGRSALFVIDQLIADSTKLQISRGAALLGVFVTEYISFAQTAMAAQGALTGIAVDQHMMQTQSTVTDPDFNLLQAFADALEVDVSDLLNRSTDREQALTAYTTALTNVAARSNDRYQELSIAEDELKTLLQTQGKERTDAERALKNAIKDKEFSQAGELQKTVLEKQKLYAETDLKRKQTEDVLSTLNTLLTLYKEKILAIRQNREILISGTRIVDVPGIEDLKIIERQKKSSRTQRKTGNEFDSLFEGTGLL